MALENKTSLVTFGYGYNATTSKTAGMISFDAAQQAIYVGDGEKANLVTPNVKDVVFANGILTITRIDGDVKTLNFTDVASAKETMAVFAALENTLKALDSSVQANAEAISNLDSHVEAMDGSIRTDFAAADASLKTAYEAADKAINDKIGDVAEGKTLVEMIADAADAASAAHSVVAENSEFLTIETSTDESGAVTYTLGTDNVAKASDLSDVSTLLSNVKAIAVAAATNEAFEAYKTSNNAAVQANATAIGEVSTNLNTHATNVELHVTKAKQDRWDAAAAEVEAFFAETVVADEVKDTLKEIQDYIASDASAAATMTANITKAQETADKGVADASAAQATANSALALGQAAATQVDFEAYKTSNDAEVAKKADKTQVATDIQNAQAAAEATAAADATNKANTAETNAKAYADKITVNGIGQTSQAITINAGDIKIGGADSSTVAAKIAQLESDVESAAAAGVVSFGVGATSSNYAEVNASTGAVSLSIKTVKVEDATESNTGVADAYDVKSYVDAKDAAMDARVDAVEEQLKWVVL